jgi:hypothetical protein
MPPSPFKIGSRNAVSVAICDLAIAVGEKESPGAFGDRGGVGIIGFDVSTAIRRKCHR